MAGWLARWLCEGLKRSIDLVKLKFEEGEEEGMLVLWPIHPAHSASTKQGILTIYDFEKATLSNQPRLPLLSPRLFSKYSYVDRRAYVPSWPGLRISITCELANQLCTSFPVSSLFFSQGSPMNAVVLKEACA